MWRMTATTAAPAQSRRDGRRRACALNEKFEKKKENFSWQSLVKARKQRDGGRVLARRTARGLARQGRRGAGAPVGLG